MNWRRLNGKRLSGTIEELVEQTILEEQKSGYRLKVCIGTDSQVRGKHVEYATVIVFLREGRGGFMFIKNSRMNNDKPLKERLLTEVTASIQVAYKICHILDRYGVGMEVHADINTDPHFKSNASLSDAMGYILAMGFAFKAKPEAFASSNCADKVVG
jgi:uncharacterized protein